MCGIFGISSKEDVGALLIKGLKRLEYRGYDSCGMVVLDGDGLLVMRKGAGEVDVVRREERFEELPAPVYVRGFVTAYAQALGLDGRRVAQGYMAHLEAARSQTRRGRLLGRK